jgi:hypothetical protein
VSTTGIEVKPAITPFTAIPNSLVQEKVHGTEMKIILQRSSVPVDHVSLGIKAKGSSNKDIVGASKPELGVR